MAPQPAHAPQTAFHHARNLFLLLATLFPSFAHAQLQQPFVYTTGGAVATRNDQSGVLTPIAASPLPPLGFPVVIDAKARFLFAAGVNSI